MPSQIDSDSGSEFKGDFHQYLKQHNIKHKVALPNRHSQVGLAENANKRIAKPLFKRMIEEEILTGHSSISWKTELLDVVDDINKLTIKRNKIKADKEKKKVKPDEKTEILNQFKCYGDACNLIPENTKVRYLLDFPIDYITKKKIGSKFRETDIRWSPEEHKVTRILLKPNQTATYIIDNNPNVAYRKDQLQIIQPNEIMPNKKAIRPLTKKKGKDVYIIDKIIKKRKHNNKIEYMVTWKGYDIEDATWEPRLQLIQDGQIEIIKNFEKYIKKQNAKQYFEFLEMPF
jgi:Chromo (CHRromatin Organisation MOdifier) domain